MRVCNFGCSRALPKTYQSYVRRYVDCLRVCVGVGAESRWVYFAEPLNGTPLLVFRVPNPGSVRWNLLLPIPVTPTQQFSVRQCIRTGI